ncbi:hypothetical protein B4113_3517 [Geobacillus sp. B4113_201601]|nr:hypothetical protein B4113_3517 [Geobacillus sp. B4113_201601]
MLIMSGDIMQKKRRLYDGGVCKRQAVSGNSRLPAGQPAQCVTQGMRPLTYWR